MENIEVYDNIAYEGAGIWIAGYSDVNLFNVLVHHNISTINNEIIDSNPLQKGGMQYER